MSYESKEFPAGQGVFFEKMKLFWGLGEFLAVRRRGHIPRGLTNAMIDPMLFRVGFGASPIRRESDFDGQSRRLHPHNPCAHDGTSLGKNRRQVCRDYSDPIYSSGGSRHYVNQGTDLGRLFAEGSDAAFWTLAVAFSRSLWLRPAWQDSNFFHMRSSWGE